MFSTNSSVFSKQLLATKASLPAALKFALGLFPVSARCDDKAAMFGYARAVEPPALEFGPVLISMFINLFDGANRRLVVRVNPGDIKTFHPSI